MVTAPERLSTVVGGGAAPSLTDADVLLKPDGVSLPAPFFQDWRKLTRSQVIYTCLFGDNAASIGNLTDFVARMHEEELMLLDYVP